MNLCDFRNQILQIDWMILRKVITSTLIIEIQLRFNEYLLKYLNHLQDYSFILLHHIKRDVYRNLYSDTIAIHYQPVDGAKNPPPILRLRIHNTFYRIYTTFLCHIYKNNN